MMSRLKKQVYNKETGATEIDTCSYDVGVDILYKIFTVLLLARYDNLWNSRW